VKCSARDRIQCLSDERELGEVQGVEFGDEVFVISAAVGHSLESTDFFVDAFQRSAGDREVVPVEDAGSIALQSIGHCQQDFDARRADSTAPVGEESFGRAFVGLLPDLAQARESALLQIVGNRQRLIQSEGLQQSRAFIL